MYSTIFLCIQVPLSPYLCFFIAVHRMREHIMSKAVAIAALIHIHLLLPALSIL